MGKLKEQVIEEIVESELFYTYTIGNSGEHIPRYVEEGYDRDKIEAEGSTWIVYVYDCMKDYYQRNKKRINREAREILLRSANS